MFKTYNELIEFAKSCSRTKSDDTYYELHHIIPRHMGGTDDNDNIVLLTLAEHVEAHYLLALENKDNEHYSSNLSAAYLIFNCKKYKTNNKRLEVIENWLASKEAQEYTLKIKQEFIKHLKENNPNKGKVYVIKRVLVEKDELEDYIAQGWTNALNEFKFIQLNNQKPERKSTIWIANNKRNLDQKGYKIIDDCPICHKEFNGTSFACCEEHEKEYLQLLVEQRKKDRAEKVKALWADDNYKKNAAAAISVRQQQRAKLREQGLIEKKVWVKNIALNNSKQINKSELEDYKTKGYELGRITEGFGTNRGQHWTLTEEQIKNRTASMKAARAIRMQDKDFVEREHKRRSEAQLKASDKKKAYWQNRVWTDEDRKLRSEATRLGKLKAKEERIKNGTQEDKCWICNDKGETLRIPLSTIDNYLNNGWKQGRSYYVTSEDEPIHNIDELNEKLPLISTSSRIYFVCQKCNKTFNRLYKEKGVFQLYCRKDLH